MNLIYTLVLSNCLKFPPQKFKVWAVRNVLVEISE